MKTHIILEHCSKNEDGSSILYHVPIESLKRAIISKIKENGKEITCVYNFGGNPYSGILVKETPEAIQDKLDVAIRSNIEMTVDLVIDSLRLKTSFSK